MNAARPTPGAPYQVPPEPNRWPSIMLAAAMHAALLAFLWIGISWQNTEPVSVEAEVWDMKVQAAAPPPAPAPEPEAAPPPPAPVPAPKVTPPPVEEKPAPTPPDIALERDKQRKLQREEERKERELAEREEQKRQDIADRKARDRADKLADKLAEKLAEKKAEKKAQDAEKKAQELADKKAADKEAEKLAAADKKKAADKLAKAKEAADNKQVAAARAAEMARLTGQAGTGTNGTAAKSTAPRSDSGYVAKITSVIKSNSAYAGDTEVPGNPKVVFHVEQLPTGEKLSLRMTRSSGIPAFDDAVRNAIDKSFPLPKKKDGTVERSLEVGFSMKDLN